MNYYDRLEIKNTASLREIRQAYQQLCLKRYEYDQLLGKSNLAGAVQAEVDLDDMEYDEDSLTYSYGCRCGGLYTVTEEQLEGGIAGTECNQCSLCVKIHYQLAEE
ncbi:hypothetical protein HDV01_007494 [Terramyces sp. JEL0728]|nr:hypothetical protein HDV01_007494 [Terramyces sp. JEL0728]